MDNSKILSLVLGIMLSALMAKMMILGSNYSIRLRIKYGKMYSDWHSWKEDQRFESIVEKYGYFGDEWYKKMKQGRKWDFKIFDVYKTTDGIVYSNYLEYEKIRKESV